MTSIYNIPEDNNKIHNKKNKKYQPITPFLKQNTDFENYKIKITSGTIEKNNNLFKETFGNMDDNISNIDLNQTEILKQSKNVLKEHSLSPMEISSNKNLLQEYEKTLVEYQTLLNEYSQNTTSYFSRVDSNNPYLGKNIYSTVNGALGYVTMQGEFKWYPNWDIVNATAGKNGCPIERQDHWSSDAIAVNVPIDYLNPGAVINTNPSLVVGTPMVPGQSCGNEGKNVLVDSIIPENAPVTYKGCYADNSSSPTMTFIGGAPPPAQYIYNSNFAQPAINSNSYKYFNDSTSVPGWTFTNACLLNNSSAWGYPKPYPNGNQCASVQSKSTISQLIQFSPGSYILSFYSVGRNCCDGSGLSNPINILLNGNKIYNVQPPLNAWNQYTTSFSIPSTGSYTITFQGTISSDRSTAFQNISITTSNNEVGTYTYDMCKQAAIDNSYKYFALQAVNSSGQGYCAVSNDIIGPTKYGTSYIGKGVALWASNTANSEVSDPGVSAMLTKTGSLSVFNSSGASIFSTDNSQATPSNYLGCYGDSSNRAMPLYNGGSQQYSLSQCQQIAQQHGSTYFGLQNSTSGKNAQCALSSDLTNTRKYGKAGNCTKIKDGSYSGGGWSNAVYKNSESSSYYYMYLQNDGNMVIYRGSSPSDNQGMIWQSNTGGKQQQPLSQYKASAGKYGQPWISSGSTLAIGDFVGSDNGSIWLIMQTDGNLVLYTSQNMVNCDKMKNSNMGGGVNANAIYQISEVGNPSLLQSLGFVDGNSKLHTYPSSMIGLSKEYDHLVNYDSGGHDIPNAGYGGATIEQCKETCNNMDNCYGFAWGKPDNACYLKDNTMYPVGEKQSNSTVDLYIRKRKVKDDSLLGPKKLDHIDSVQWSKYITGENISNKSVFGLKNTNQSIQNKLDKLFLRLSDLASQITTHNIKLQENSKNLIKQSLNDRKAFDSYLNQYNKIVDFESGNFEKNESFYENILNDSDIVVLQENYNYLFWSILAIGTVIISMNVLKK